MRCAMLGYIIVFVADWEAKSNDRSEEKCFIFSLSNNNSIARKS